MIKTCLFCSIIARNIPAKILFEDTNLIAFYDINPKSQVHFLVVPREHITSMLDIKEKHQDLLGKMMLFITKIAKELSLVSYKIIINNGEIVGQEIFHLHIHVLGVK